MNVWNFLSYNVSNEIKSLGWVIVGVLMLLFCMAVSDATDSLFNRLWNKKD